MYGTCRRKPVLDECFKTPFQLTYALFLILYRCSTVTARTGRLFVTLTLTWMERQTESNQGTPTVCGSQEWRPQEPQQDIQVCLSVCMSVCVCLSVCVCQPSQSCGEISLSFEIVHVFFLYLQEYVRSKHQGACPKWPIFARPLRPLDQFTSENSFLHFHKTPQSVFWLIIFVMTNNVAYKVIINVIYYNKTITCKSNSRSLLYHYSFQ